MDGNVLTRRREGPQLGLAVEREGGGGGIGVLISMIQRTDRKSRRR